MNIPIPKCLRNETGRTAILSLAIALIAAVQLCFPTSDRPLYTWLCVAAIGVSLGTATVAIIQAKRPPRRRQDDNRPAD